MISDLIDLSVKGKAAWDARFLFVARKVPILVEAYDENKLCVFWNDKAAEVSGYSAQEIEGRPEAIDILFPDEVKKGEMMKIYPLRGYGFEQAVWTMTSKDGKKHIISWINISKLFRPIPSWAKWAIGIDLTQRLEAEAALENKNRELLEQSQRLIEVNAALNVLLKKQTEDRKNLIADFVSNLDQLFLPFLDRLKQTKMQPQQEALVDILMENTQTSIDSLGGPLSNVRSKLTLTEFEVATLISRGKSTQEIADILNISSHTAGVHRKGIRRKLGLVKKGVNLAAYLQSAFNGEGV